MYSRLIISQIDRTFDPEVDVALGPWCFIGAEKIYPSWVDLDFLDVFRSAEDLDETEIKCRRLAVFLISEWTTLLNQKHKVNYSPTYWRFVLNSWMFASVHGLWARYKYIDTFVDKYGGHSLEVELAPATVPQKFLGVYEFQHHQRRSYKFDYWVSSLIIRKLAPNTWTIKEPNRGRGWESLDHIPETPPIKFLGKKSAMGTFSRKLFGRLRVDSVPGTKISKLLFSLLLGIIPEKGVGKNHYVFPTENVSGEFPPKLIEVLDYILESTLPDSHGSSFLSLDKKAKKKELSTGRIFIGNTIPYSEVRRLELAHALDRGEKLISVQHGSGSGGSRRLSWAAEMEYLFHAYLTWGWTEHGTYSGNFIPLPSPLLSKYSNKHKEKNSSLIMVAAKIDFCDGRGVENLRPLDWMAYRNMKLDFIEGLDLAPKNNLIYYAYTRGTMDLDDVNFLDTKLKGLRVVSKGLNKDMMNCRLLILDHPGTTLHIGLAANVPTVCYWNPDFFYTAAQAEPYFELLRQCKMLFNCPVAAAEHINKVWPNIDSWWLSDDVQNARESWSNNFAKNERFWWWAWIKALVKLQCSN